MIHVPTCSFGKTNIEAWFREHSVVNQGPNTYVMGLIGNPQGLSRHCEHYGSLGFKDRTKILIVERDSDTYDALHRTVGHYGIPKDNVFFSDVFDLINNRGITLPGPIVLFDLDGTSLFHLEQLKTLQFLMRCNVPTIHMVCTNRGGKWLRTQPYPDSVQRVWCPIRKDFVIPQKDKIEYLLRQDPLSENYHINLKPYCGRGSTYYDRRGAQMIAIALQLKWWRGK